MLIGDGKAQTSEGGKERMEAGEISHLEDFHFSKCVFWPSLYLTARAPWGNSPRQALAGGPGYRATWPLQLEPHPGRMRSPTGFYFNGWIMAWFAVNFASQYDAAIFPAFPAPKWDVWCYFKNGFHWNLVNLNGKTFLWAYSQVLCQEVPKWAFAVTQGMHCTPLGPVHLYWCGLHTFMTLDADAPDHKYTQRGGNRWYSSTSPSVLC